MVFWVLTGTWFAIFILLTVLYAVSRISTKRHSIEPGEIAQAYVAITVLWGGLVFFLFIYVHSGAVFDGKGIRVLGRFSSAPIVSLGVRDKATGSFFLGCGSIGGTSYYVYYRRLADGGLVRDKYPADRVVVYETDKRAPAIEGFTSETVSQPNLWPWSITVNYGGRSIFVPKGTIIREFKLE